MNAAKRNRPWMPSPPSLDDLAALDSARRRELAAALRSVAETFADVSDGKTASHDAATISPRPTMTFASAPQAVRTSTAVKRLVDRLRAEAGVV